MTRLLSVGSKLSKSWGEKQARKYYKRISNFVPFPSDRGIEYDHESEMQMVKHCSDGETIKNSVDWAERDDKPVKEAPYRIRFDL